MRHDRNVNFLSRAGGDHYADYNDWAGFGKECVSCSGIEPGQQNNAEEAVNAAMAIKPKVVIPFHWGSVIGSKVDAEKFQSLYSGKSVILDMN